MSHTNTPNPDHNPDLDLDRDPDRGAAGGDTGDTDGGNVRWLPVVRPTGRVDHRDGGRVDPTAVAVTGPATVVDPATAVVDAELISDQEYRDRQRERALVRYAGYRRDVLVVARGARRVATHQRTAAVVKAVVRNVLYVPAGVGVVARRVWEAHSSSRYERLLRAAEAAGDWDRLAEWETRAEQAKQARHERAMDWLNAPGKQAKAVAIGAGSVVAVLFGLGVVLAVAQRDPGMVLVPLGAMLGVVRWVWWFVAAYGLLVLYGGTALAVMYAWQQGRDKAEVPRWLTVPETAGQGGQGDRMDALPDEGTIVNALKNLNISGFNKALKQGWRITFLTPPIVDGKGWRCQLALPPACPVEEIVKRKPMLAHNLVRFPAEVWPTEPQPSVLDLWVAKPGALSGPVDPWPLLAELDTTTGTDYFAGVPAGITVKGDVVNGPLCECNHVVGGMMGSGKTTLVICLLCGAMLDPLVDIDVVVMADNADYEPMRPRLRTLITGALDDPIAHGDPAAACMRLLGELYDELGVRGKALREDHNARSVSRKLAEQDPRLRPRVVVVDECQNLFIGDHGKNALEVTTKLMSTARKYAITLIFLTPEPSADALPRKLISVASHRACFAIGDQIGNDAVLGTGSYKAGISAVGLTPKTDEGPGDVGTCVQRGFTPRPGLLRGFYLDQDQVARVTARAVQLREQRGITPADRPAPRPQRDPLADIYQVLRGEPRVRTQTVLARLAELDPATYERWTHHDLYAALPEQAQPYKTSGTIQVARDRILEALTQRDHGEGVGEPEPDGDPTT